MRSSGRNNPSELQRANAPPNPFMSGSCDKHLTSSEWHSPPFVKGMRSILRLGRHVRRRRIESEEEEKMQRGSSNPLKHFLGPPLSRLGLAESASFGRSTKKIKKICNQFSHLPTAGRSYWQPIRVDGGEEGTESEVRE